MLRILALSTLLSAPAEPPPSPAGQWVADLPSGDGQSLRLVVDLGRIGPDWIGEFDLVEVGVTDYPVGVSVAGSAVQLDLTALRLTFRGFLTDGGRVLAGAGDTMGEQELIVFRREADEPAFSPGLLALEAGSGAPSRLHPLAPDGAELRRRFNEDRDHARLVLLLSPT